MDSTEEKTRVELWLEKKITGHVHVYLCINIFYETWSQKQTYPKFQKLV